MTTRDTPPLGVNLYITTCVHGVDLRFTPRCYLCRPEAQEARPIRYRIHGTLIDRGVGGRKYDVALMVEAIP